MNERIEKLDTVGRVTSHSILGDVFVEVFIFFVVTLNRRFPFLAAPILSNLI